MHGNISRRKTFAAPQIPRRRAPHARPACQRDAAGTLRSRNKPDHHPVLQSPARECRGTNSSSDTTSCATMAPHQQFAVPLPGHRRKTRMGHTSRPTPDNFGRGDFRNLLQRRKFPTRPSPPPPPPPSYSPLRSCPSLGPALGPRGATNANKKKFLVVHAFPETCAHREGEGKRGLHTANVPIITHRKFVIGHEKTSEHSPAAGTPCAHSATRAVVRSPATGGGGNQERGKCGMSTFDTTKVCQIMPRYLKVQSRFSGRHV